MSLETRDTQSHISAFGGIRVNHTLMASLTSGKVREYIDFPYPKLGALTHCVSMVDSMHAQMGTVSVPIQRKTEPTVVQSCEQSQLPVLKGRLGIAYQCEGHENVVPPWRAKNGETNVQS